MEHLQFLSNAESCWYIINGEINHEYSLARRLGFYLKEQYYAFLVAAGLANYKYTETNEKDEVTTEREEWRYMIDGANSPYIECNNKFFDRKNAQKGIKQRSGKHRQYYLLLRIGVKNPETDYDPEDVAGWSHSNISEQLKLRAKEGIHRAPSLPSLSPHQRTFLREIRSLSDDVIVSDADFYNNLSNTNLEPTDDDDDDDDDEQMSDGETEDDSDTEMEHEETEDAQPPAKKAKLADVLSLGNVCGREFAEAEADEFALNYQQNNLICYFRR